MDLTDSPWQAPLNQNPSDFTCPVPNIVVLEFVFFVNKSVGVVECPVFVFVLSLSSHP